MAARINDEWVHKTMKQNLMIDLETLGTKPNSAILSIGAVYFDKDGVDEIKDPVLSIKIKNNPLSVLVHDIDSLPEEYKRTKTIVEADKTKLKQDKPDLNGVSYVNVKKLMLK